MAKEDKKRTPRRGPWGGGEPAKAWSGKMPAAQWRAIDALGRRLAADPAYEGTRWTRNALVTFLLWRGLASVTPEELAAGEWNSQAPKALKTWLGEEDNLPEEP